MRNSTFLIGGILSLTINIDAYAAPSVRAYGTTDANPTTLKSARAGSLRTNSARTGALTKQTIKTNAAPTVSNSNTRLAATNNKKTKSFISKTSTSISKDAIESRIDELENAVETQKIDKDAVYTKEEVEQLIQTETQKIVEQQATDKSNTYTKEEVDELLDEMNKKLPQIDDRGNMTWTDPNGNLVGVHAGDVVIGGDDIIIVDGQLSTTSTNPIQNKVVTNALNEKQGKSRTLSFGNSDGGWTTVATGSDYIELHTNQSNAKEIRIRPTMIATSLDNMDNEDQLITAGAVQDALNAITSTSGGGTQPEYYFNLTNLETRHGGLVQKYTYETNAPNTEILSFALNACGGTFSDRWCTLYENHSTSFSIIKRQAGHSLEDITSLINYNTGNIYMAMNYAVNLPDGVTPQTYVNEHICANRSNTCYMYDAWYSGSNNHDFNDTLEPLYVITVNIE